MEARQIRKYADRQLRFKVEDVKKADPGGQVGGWAAV
jgi:hypothetical protein